MEDIFRLVRENKINVLKNILNKSIINARNVEKQSLLQQAIVSKHFDIAKILISKNINVNSEDSNGQTALHYIPLYKNLEIAKLILENGGDVNKQDSWGNTPLWTAIFNSRRQYDLVILYLEFHAKIDIINHSNKTCYDLAKILNDKDLLTILEKYK
ncbi:ankyrin repeat domain-containing protein [Apibacter sp. ESL0432]|uniref:ankyrin repeat domain-containing protein n=1 Tax=Apibacter sp. ESL0432 TaxID=2704652 RepID=UPI001C6A2964|nr:ankyrin repeat domain-containing protein [Apibacter sp. ESL0432]QYN49057.1 ankyrin repeat domain-containing protein [Apibacter sp. ESL0432]